MTRFSKRVLILGMILLFLIVACTTQTNKVKVPKEVEFTIELSVDRAKGERWIWTNTAQNPDMELLSIGYAQKVNRAPANASGGLETFTFIAHEAGTYILEFACAGEMARTHTATATISQ